MGSYGTTSVGGAHNYGTVFGFSVSLGPFVQTLPNSGAVATPVTILGNNLIGTTSVTFNGVPATFNVISGTDVTTTVPTGRDHRPGESYNFERHVDQ